MKNSNAWDCVNVQDSNYINTMINHGIGKLLLVFICSFIQNILKQCNEK